LTCAYIFLTGGLFFAPQPVLEPRRSEGTQGNGSLRYLFEEYAFDTDRRELYRGADVAPSAPQVFDLLDYLIRNRERVVSKDDLINAIWNGRIVSDAALTTRLNVARNAIGDFRRGTASHQTCRARASVSSGQSGSASARRRGNRRRLVRAAEASLALPDKPSIAILPFANLSSDPEQDYFADGRRRRYHHGALAVQVAVRHRTQFKLYLQRQSRRTQASRRELGVRYVLEGSVRKAAGKVRITSQLIDATSGAHLWADRYDGD